MKKKPKRLASNLFVVFLILLALFPVFYMYVPRLYVNFAARSVCGGLSLSQMQEDADYLWHTLEEGWPYYAHMRRVGKVPDRIKNEFMQLMNTADEI